MQIWVATGDTLLYLWSQLPQPFWCYFPYVLLNNITSRKSSLIKLQCNIVYSILTYDLKVLSVPIDLLCNVLTASKRLEQQVECM